MREKTGIILCGLLAVHVLRLSAQVAKPKEEHRTVNEVLDHTVLNLGARVRSRGGRDAGG